VDELPDSSDCVFCAIVAGTVPCAKVAEDATTFAFMDIDPGAEGHLLVIPKRHSADLFDIAEDDLAATVLAARRIAEVVIPELDADGVNLLHCSGAEAWQTVFHFHLHVIPRYRDRAKDRLELPFEPGRPADAGVIAERARVLAAALERSDAGGAAGCTGSTTLGA
jgi:histidine triad (HIT) family protein